MTNHVILNFVFFFICSLYYICLGDSNNQTYGPSASIVRVSVHKVICALSNIMSKIRIFLWCPYKEVRTQDFSAQCYRQLSSLLLMQFQVLPVRRLITYGPLHVSTRTGPAS